MVLGLQEVLLSCKMKMPLIALDKWERAKFSA